MLELNLQLFAEGGAGAGDSANQADSTGVKGDFDVDAAIEAYRESKKPKGKSFKASDFQVQKTAPAVTEQAPAAEEAPPVKLSFKDLIDSDDYREEAKAYMSQMVKERLKNSKEAEKTLKELSPALEILAKSRGLDAKDYLGLAKAVTEDASFYEEEALRAGVPVESMMQITQLQREAEEAREQLAQMEAQREAAETVSFLLRQEQDVKTRYPDFDLRTEMQNQRFYDLVTGPGNVSVEDAYWMVHRQELLQRMAGSVSQQTKADVSRSIQSGAFRPMESAAKPGGSAPQVKPDPRSFTTEQLRSIKERARRGETISFD